MTWRAMSDRPYRLIPRGVREAVRSAGHVGVHARVVRRLRAPASQGLAASPKRTSERCHSTQYPRQCSCLSPNITSVWCHSTQYPRQCSCLSPNITSERCHSTQYPRQYSACSPKRTSVWCNSTQHPRQYSAIPPNVTSVWCHYTQHLPGPTSGSSIPSRQCPGAYTRPLLSST